MKKLSCPCYSHTVDDAEGFCQNMTKHVECHFKLCYKTQSLHKIDNSTKREEHPFKSHYRTNCIQLRILVMVSIVLFCPDKVSDSVGATKTLLSFVYDRRYFLGWLAQFGRGMNKEVTSLTSWPSYRKSLTAICR